MISISPVEATHAIWAGLIEPSEPKHRDRLRSAIEELSLKGAFEEVCWQPSAGNDFSDVHCLARLGCEALRIPRAPRLFVHTDAIYPNRPGESPGTGLEAAGGRIELENIPVRLAIKEWFKRHASLLQDHDLGGDAPFDFNRHVGEPTFQGNLRKLSAPRNDLRIPDHLRERRRDVEREWHNHHELNHEDGEESWVLEIGMSNWQFIMLVLGARLRTRTIYRSNEGLGFGFCNVSINGAAKWFRTMGCEVLIDMPCQPWGAGIGGERLDEHADRIGEAFLRRPVPYVLSREASADGAREHRGRLDFMQDNACWDRRMPHLKTPEVLRLNRLSEGAARDFDWMRAVESYFRDEELPDARR